MKNNNYNNISIYIFLLLCLFTSHANSNLLSVAKIPSNGGYMIFELYDDPALIAECRGMNASGVLAKLEKGDIKIGYGSGCWTADINGYIHLYIKSLRSEIRIVYLTIPNYPVSAASARGISGVLMPSTITPVRYPSLPRMFRGCCIRPVGVSIRFHRTRGLAS